MLLPEERVYLKGWIRVASLILLCSTLFKVGNPIMPTNVRDSQATQAQGHRVTTIASFGGIKYYVDPKPIQVISFQPSRPTDGFFSSVNRDLRPCTVICSSGHLNIDGIPTVYARLDDVWTSAFLEGETNRRHKFAIEFDCLQQDTS